MKLNRTDKPPRSFPPLEITLSLNSSSTRKFAIQTLNYWHRKSSKYSNHQSPFLLCAVIGKKKKKISNEFYRIVNEASIKLVQLSKQQNKKKRTYLHLADKLGQSWHYESYKIFLPTEAYSAREGITSASHWTRACGT